LDLVALQLPSSKETSMYTQHYPGFYMAGLATRTSNAAEMSGKGKIGCIWQAFLQPGLAAKIPNKIGVDLIAVYTDYETDHTGHYTYFLGLPVLSGHGMPSGLIVRHIPPGHYAVITSKRGPVKKVVREVWQHIWAMPPEELGGKRAFRCDYEIYDQRSADPENTQIEVYVGLR
jgi:predicted transcriptional regulator YdeE